jgi:molybdate transport system ATP-binding protein
MADVRVDRDSFVLDVSLGAEPGEVVGVLGPNGAGKSTLLRALAGLVSLSTGRIQLDGTVLDDPAAGTFVPADARPVGLVFQDYLLFPHLSVRENVAFAPRCAGAGRPEARRIADEWLARFQLGALAQRRPGTLSGGQAQRVALARTLAARPSLLLLDEPLAALDAGSRLAVRTWLREHLTAFGGPSLVVTHDPVEAMVLADRLVVVEDGRVAQDGRPAEVARRPRTDYVARLVGLNLYRGTAADGVIELDGGGRLQTADTAARGPVLAAVRPSAVGVYVEPPHGASPRNAWQGTVTSVEQLGDRVRLAIHGRPEILADVTAAAVAELRLAPGRPVWTVVKATEVDMYAAGESGPGAAAVADPPGHEQRGEQRDATEHGDPWR